jgi:hypothetical protein
MLSWDGPAANEETLFYFDPDIVVVTPGVVLKNGLTVVWRL